MPMVDPDVTLTMPMDRTRAEKVLQVRHRLAILRGEDDIAQVLKEHLKKMADDRFNPQMTDVLPGFQNAGEIADFEEEFETSDTAPAEGITVVHNHTERAHGLNEDNNQVSDSTLIPTDPTVDDSATERLKVLRVRHRMALFLFRGKKKFAST
ncbi:PREDICTED: uncharacterized protein LOC109469539 [Branchiostoma belcheri]|uniref:Uncharacterized protein LOC109469539 n=1 Tax=Branchiostoma belcheri TaxID=7741 RepID=A0A6P4YPM6_BRABE|nr:PREDICTED: uncharacterized protein LOC109469539 [Branchiostoma belcheri]